MQRLEVSGAVRPIYGSLGFKRLIVYTNIKGQYKCQQPEGKDNNGTWHTGMKEPGREKVRGKRGVKKKNIFND